MTLLNKIFSYITPVNIFNFLSILICFYIFYFYYKYFTRINPLPGPIPNPFDLFFVIFNPNLNVDDLVNKANKIYGNNGIFELFIAGDRYIIITKPEYARKFLAPSSKDRKIYWKRFPTVGLLKELNLDEKGLALNTNFDKWKLYRSLFQHSIEKICNSNETSKLINELFEELTNYWIDLKQNNSTIDFTAWIKRYLNDLITGLTTGKRSFAINLYYQKLINKKISKEIMESEYYIECITHFFVDTIVTRFPKILRNIPFIKARIDKFIDVCDSLYARNSEIVRERRKEIEKIVNNNNFDMKQLGNDLLTTFITANTLYQSRSQKNEDSSLLKPFTDDEIKIILIDALVGGTDTTVNSLSYILYYISHHPNVKKKLVDEIESVFKTDLTLDDLEKLKYCEAIILETLRVRSPVSILSRYNNEPDEVAGYKWPTNTPFFMYVREFNNNPLYWEDPDKFIPERFLKSHETEKLYNFSTTTFGAGLRNCPGKKFVMIEMKMFIALLYRKFDVELVDMQAPLEIIQSAMALCKKLNIKISPRNS